MRLENLKLLLTDSFKVERRLATVAAAGHSCQWKEKKF